MPMSADEAHDNQPRVFAFLTDPRTHGGAKVARIDTHAASVFLAGPLAYKVKRAIRLSFLDYSTLPLRKAACERELEVNRRFAPDIYLNVSVIAEDGEGRLHLGGSGRPVEYAVVMRRFDETRTLDRLAEKGSLDEGLMARLGTEIAQMHLSLPAFDWRRWLDFAGQIIRDNHDILAGYPDAFAPQRVTALRDASLAALDRLRPLIERRGRAGFVRECHGDLHLRNIALIGGAAVPFDAIEFDPLIAAGDVLYDLAFLLMDLIGCRQPAAANTVFNRYLVASGGLHLDALGALPLFLSLRAAIRAKVTALRMTRLPPKERGQPVAEAASYFGHAESFLSPPPAQLVAVGGLSGTGKSVLARRLAPGVGAAPGAVILRSDIERKGMFGVPETTRLPPSAYGSGVTEAVYTALAAKAARILATGHSVIVDAVFSRTIEARGIASAALRAGVPFAGLFLEADLQTRLSRVERRTGDASDADSEVARMQESYGERPPGWARIDASGTPEVTLRLAQEALQTAGR